ncbi:follicle-stimulating hormone receptor-like isoform X2 [Oculina patagonica]
MITELPDSSFSAFSKLVTLHLDENKLKSLPLNAFKGVKHLEILSLKGNNFRTCPEFGVSLESLDELYLTGNNMHSIGSDVFRRVPNIQHLWLDDNNLTEVPTHALEKLKFLKYLSLDQNKIRIIKNGSFQSLSRLLTLLLFHNEIMEIEDDGFKGLDILESLHLRNNNLSKVPVALKDVKNLQQLELSYNPITEIQDYAFKGLVKLHNLVFTWEKLISVGHNAFAFLPSLKSRLRLVSVKLNKFPNLTGTSSLQYLTLTFNEIRELPENLCQNLKNLVDLTLNFNKIVRIPDLAECTSLSVLKIEHNEIESIGSSLRNLGNLKDLTLKGNKIKRLPSRTFEGVTKLETLNLAKNEIKSIADDAFAPFEMIKVLDLSFNAFPVLPARGLKTLETLRVRDNRELKELPAAKLTKIRLVEAHYPYHCCEFRKEKKQKEKTVEKKNGASESTNAWTWDKNEEVTFLRNSYEDNSTVFTSDEDDMSGFGSGNVDPLLRDFDGSTEDDLQSTNSDGSGQPEVIYEHLIPIEEEEDRQVECTPEPADPFFPCDDLMDSSLLRIGVWIVFLLALLGNAIVIFIIITRSSRIDVSRFLICNLAVADLCMGVYLGLLAIVDASTRGNFRSYGVEWQLSSGCKTAGFLAVLSSETSVFTLTVITIERYIAITHALDITKKMSLKKTSIVMLIGWCFALTVATLPLFEISDYTKFSVCLPFETGDMKSLVYVTTVLVLNGSAFIVILTCYVKIYTAIRGSNAWNTNDSRTAQRMALLIFTDFACWAPITFLSLAAAFGGEFVSLKDAKIFTVFVFPLNSCANPFLYAIFTGQFKRDCINLCRRVKTSQIPKITSSRRKYSISSAEMRRNSQVSSSYGLEGMVAKLRTRDFRRNSLPPSMRLMANRGGANRSLEMGEKEIIVERVTSL